MTYVACSWEAGLTTLETRRLMADLIKMFKIVGLKRSVKRIVHELPGDVPVQDLETDGSRVCYTRTCLYLNIGILLSDVVWFAGTT